MKNTFLSLVLTTEQPIPVEVLSRFSEHLKSNYSEHEILLIDYSYGDTFADGIMAVLQNIERIRYLRLSETYSSELAMAAGMENAIGDIVVIGTVDNMTLEAMDSVVDRCFAGIDVVIGCSEVKRPVWYRVARNCFLFFAKKLIQYNLPKSDTGLRAVSRRAANAVMTHSRFHHHFLIQISQSGFRIENRDYSLPHSLKKQVSIRHAASRGISLLVFNSILPLRVANFMGLCASFMAFLFGLYSVAVHFFKHHVIEGWTTMILFMSAQFFVLFVIFSFFGEYLARLLIDHSGRSPYNVVYEKNSSVMIDIEKLNVLNSSETDSVNLSQTGRNR